MENEMNIEKFLNRINQLLAERHWTGAELCRVANISENTLSRWASSKSEPSFSALNKISKAFGLTIVELLSFSLSDEKNALKNDMNLYFDKLGYSHQKALVTYLREVTNTEK